MADESFVPFVPRHLSRVTAEPAEPAQKPVPVKTEPESEGAIETKAEPKVEVQMDPTQALETAAPVIAAQENAASKTARHAPPRPCEHGLEIRREAIRLAAIACGRALRHAVLLHPGVIAAFVDDAIAAAGSPQHARIRVHPASIKAVRASHHDRIDDEEMSPGDVVIECNGVTISADIDTRAELLVRAAAEQ